MTHGRILLLSVLKCRDDMQSVVPEEGGICTPDEAKHLGMIYRRAKGKPNEWIRTGYSAIPDELIGLKRRGFIDITLVSDSDLDPAMVGVMLTAQGVIVAKLLGFILTPAI